MHPSAEISPGHTLPDKPFNVLFLCTGNSARSVIAEALLNVLGDGRFRAFSAGSHPSGHVQPMAAGLATDLGYDASLLRSKSWDEFAAPGAPVMDLVITVCDNAAAEPCPVWLGVPISAHWGAPDPAAVNGNQDTRRRAYLATSTLLRGRVERLLALPLDKLERLEAQQRIREIGTAGTP